MEAMTELEDYIAKNQNEHVYTVESEESDLFEQIDNCEHSVIESQSLTETEEVKRFGCFDDTQSDDAPRLLGY